MLAYAFKSKPTDVSNIHASDLMNFDKDKQKIQIENQKNVQGQRAGGAGIVDIQRLSNSRNLGMDFDGSENPNKNPKVMKNPVLVKTKTTIITTKTKETKPQTTSTTKTTASEKSTASPSKTSKKSKKAQKDSK